MNAIIMAAGTASRFVPLSEEFPKGLLEVKGELLIERQIRQLQESGVGDITIVTGYKAEMFSYLRSKFNVKTVFNEDYNRFNNISSIMRVIDQLGDTFICCSDHYFSRNVFSEPVQESFYAARFAFGKTTEYCLQINEYDYITGVTVNGNDAWYMAGHAFFTKSFSDRFKVFLSRDYSDMNNRQDYWEDVYLRHLNELPMQVRRYSDSDVYEFDSIDELRLFDTSYISDTRSSIVKRISYQLSCSESDLFNFKRIVHEGTYLLFSFCKGNNKYIYSDLDHSIQLFE